MSRTRIKICGVTRVEDALAAADAGADAIGIVMQPGARRYVADGRAREIVHALPPFVTPVALFVDQDFGTIAVDIGVELGPMPVQLHGNETPETVRDMHPLRVIKAIRVTRGGLQAELDRWREAPLAGIVLETSVPGAAGGTGSPNDWPLIADAQRRGVFAGFPHLILAGGLTPETVADVVRSIRPWAVDVSSGVESSVGVKSVEKMRAFISAVRAADDDV